MYCYADIPLTSTIRNWPGIAANRMGLCTASPEDVLREQRRSSRASSGPERVRRKSRERLLEQVFRLALLIL